MVDVLQKIIADKAEHIAQKKQEKSVHDLQLECQSIEAPRGFCQKLRDCQEQNKYGLIAEIKKASPSKGLIRADFNPEDLARQYQQGGATCLSVLTDMPYFQGDDSYIQAVRNVVDLPVLRKDFMIDPYQIIESRSLGADCILIIMAALSDQQAQDLSGQAQELGMDVLVEVHNGAELQRAIPLGTEMIGINNRNLKTLAIDLATTEILSKDVPKERLLVAESGLYSHDDLLRMAKIGANTFLIGESLMRQDDVTEATRQILGQAA